MRKLKFYCVSRLAGHGSVCLYSLAALVLTAIILAFPSECLQLSLRGLNLWFERMIPALFPFMVLSGIIIRMNLTDTFVRILTPLLGRVFRVKGACVYGILVGFLCGFPMGAHVAAQLYEQKKISRAEASFLLFFCNNIGPVYFLSFVLPTLSLKTAATFLFGMYGLPFLYGIFLRYTLFRGSIPPKEANISEPGAQSPSLLRALDESVFGALVSIARLGGYMIFFNLLFILPTLAVRVFSLEPPLSTLFTGGFGCLLEITGGIGLIGDRAPFLVLCILPFGGLSCIAQTYGMIKETDLSITEYVMHKMILTAITVFYYLLRAKTAF